jgi:hypothetical protein
MRKPRMLKVNAWEKVIPVSAFLKLVDCQSGIAFRYQSQYGTAGHGLYKGELKLTSNVINLLIAQDRWLWPQI